MNTGEVGMLSVAVFGWELPEPMSWNVGIPYRPLPLDEDLAELDRSKLSLLWRDATEGLLCWFSLSIKEIVGAKSGSPIRDGCKACWTRSAMFSITSSYVGFLLSNLQISLWSAATATLISAESGRPRVAENLSTICVDSKSSYPVLKT